MPTEEGVPEATIAPSSAPAAPAHRHAADASLLRLAPPTAEADRHSGKGRRAAERIAPVRPAADDGHRQRDAPPPGNQAVG